MGVGGVGGTWEGEEEVGRVPPAKMNETLRGFGAGAFGAGGTFGLFQQK